MREYPIIKLNRWQRVKRRALETLIGVTALTLGIESYMPGTVNKLVNNTSSLIQGIYEKSSKYVENTYNQGKKKKETSNLEETVENSRKIVDKQKTSLTPIKDTSLESITDSVYENGTSIRLDENEINELIKYLINEPAKANEFLVYKWIEKYSSGSHKGTIEKALQKNMHIIPAMKRIFREHGLSEDLVYLFITESAGDPEAVSNRGAVGLWQFIPSTAKKYGLFIDNRIGTIGYKTKYITESGKVKAIKTPIVGSVYDERKFSLLATIKAAEFLKDEQKFFKNNTEPTSIVPLMLAQYNSGMPRNQTRGLWVYCNSNSSNKNGISFNYDGFLRFNGNRLKEIKERCKRKDYRCTKEIEGFVKETLNYPPKWYAVKKIIEREGLDTYLSSKKTDFASMFSIMEGYYSPYTMYTVKKGDTIQSIAKRYGVSVDSIKSLNKIKTGIKPNEIIKVPSQRGKAAVSNIVSELCTKYGMSEDEFYMLNPHLKSALDLPSSGIFHYAVPAMKARSAANYITKNR
ncbi:MAG: lytic transglycosylase [Candidatus Woesearchaeota archaeon]